MKLILRDGSSISGELSKGYLPSWDWRRNGGSYHKKIDFLSMHWEINHNSPNKVRFHVESPMVMEDIILNLMKNKIIIGVLSELFQINAKLESGMLEIGKRLKMTDKCKSTEVFHVVLHDGKEKLSYYEKIKLIHSELGETIDNIINKYIKDISALFRE